MAEEIQENTPQPEPTPQPELSPIEQKAMEQGWVPQDQWEGDPEQWRPAKEFVDRGELFKKIDEVKRENKQLRQGLEALSSHHAKVKETEYKRALETLKLEKRDALAEGEYDRVLEIDDKIAETREEMKAAKEEPKQAQSQPDPKFVAWLDKNPWYSNNRAMKAVADEVTRELLERGVRDPDTILSEVEKEVKKEFATKFTNPNRSKPSAVDGGGTNKGSSKSDDVEMSEADKQVMHRILSVTPGLTKAKYLEEYKGYKGR